MIYRILIQYLLIKSSPHPYGPALGDGPASGVGGGEGSIGQNSFVAREYIHYAAMLGGKWRR